MAAGGFALADAVYRIFEGTRAIDYVILGVDVLVLIAIVLFEGPKWWHERKANKAARKLAPFMERGCQLQATLTSSMVDQPSEETMQWVRNIEQWSTETEQFLANLSFKASTAFTLVTHVSETDRMARDRYGMPFRAHGPFGDTYQVLLAKPDNLQKILENPEAFF